MWKSVNGGYNVYFETKNSKCYTWFSNPPSDIDHVDITYLQGRLENVRTESQVEFIKERFKEEAKKLGIE